MRERSAPVVLGANCEPFVACDHAVNHDKRNQYHRAGRGHRRRTASDSAFRARLLSDPAATLASAGVAVPDGVSLQVPENSATLLHPVVPDKPAGVSDADLQQTSASTSTPSSTAEKLEAYGRLVVSTWTDSALKARRSSRSLRRRAR